MGKGDTPQGPGQGAVGCPTCWEGSRREELGAPAGPSAAAAPVSQPLLTLRPTGLAVGDVAELLCEAQSGSPPVLYSFYLNGEMLGNRVAPCGRAASLLFRVTSERDAGNYSCEAENSVSKETSKPGGLSLDGKSCSQPGPGPQSCQGQTSLLCVPPAMPGTVLGTEQALGDQQGMDLLGVSV